MSDLWPVVEVVGTDEEAQLITGFLRSVGIACGIESLRFHQEPVNFGRLGEVRVRVPRADLERAREELESRARGGLRLVESEDGVPAEGKGDDKDLP